MIKYIRPVSDLHLEGFSGRNPETLALDFIPRDDRDAESILVLAGDISSHPDQLVSFVQVCLQRFPHVIFVPGNHEYYKHNHQTWNSEVADRFERYCPGLVYALGEVGYFELEDVRFIFGTLWGDGGPTLSDQGQVGFYLNDFRLITYNDPERNEARRLRVADMVYEHKKQKAKINEYLLQPFDGKSVVVTHHLPSRRLVSTRFWPSDGSDGANGGFVGGCDDILAYDHAPNLWIHGHTHDRISTKLWKTRIVCNPAGYRGEYATEFNTFMRREQREDGTYRAVAVPVFIDISTLEVA